MDSQQVLHYVSGEKWWGGAEYISVRTPQAGMPKTIFANLKVYAVFDLWDFKTYKWYLGILEHLPWVDVGSDCHIVPHGLSSPN